MFEEHILNTLTSYLLPSEDRTRLLQTLKFNSQSIIDLEALLQNKLDFEVTINLDYDVLQWRSTGYNQLLENFKCKSKYVFDIEEEDKTLLLRMIKQYSHENFNVTLRKMSEYMPLKNFFLTEKYGKVTSGRKDLIAHQIDRAGVGQ